LRPSCTLLHGQTASALFTASNARVSLEHGTAMDGSQAPTELTGRPERGLGHYLRDVVYGALDGIITTMAVIAGSAGAQLPARIAIILGLANLVADGLSMGASNYLGLKSELEQAGRGVAAEAPWRHGRATAAAFVLVGSLPLLGYVVAPAAGVAPLAVATVFSAVALLAAGAVRAPFVHKRVLPSSLEMLFVGACAGAAAYGVGAAADRLLR
jgi:vacuolar iron transporter family protein